VIKSKEKVKRLRAVLLASVLMLAAVGAGIILPAPGARTAKAETPTAGVAFPGTGSVLQTDYGQFEEGPNTVQAWIWVDKNEVLTGSTMIIGYNSTMDSTSGGQNSRPDGAGGAAVHHDALRANAFGLVMTDTGLLRAYWRAGNRSLSGYDLRRSEWLFVTVVRNKALRRAEFYINGEMLGTDGPWTAASLDERGRQIGYSNGSDWDMDIPYAAGGFTQTNPLWIGRHGTGGTSPFPGRVAGVTLFSAARTAEEIKADMISMPADKDTPETNADGVIFSRRFNASAPPVLTDKRGQGGLPEADEYTPLNAFAAQMEAYFEVADDVGGGSLVFDFEPGALSGGGSLLRGAWEFTVRARDFAGNLSAESFSGRITVNPAEQPPAGVDFRGAARVSYGRFDEGPNTMQAWIWAGKNQVLTNSGMIIGYNSNQTIPAGHSAAYSKNAFGLVMTNEGLLQAYWRETNIALTLTAMRRVNPGAAAAYDLRQGEWLFVSVVRNAAERRAEFYVNGELTGINGGTDNETQWSAAGQWAADIPYAAGGYTQTNDLYIGHHGVASPDALNQFAGRIAGITLLSTARTAAEIKADMARMPAAGEPGVIFRRVFNDGAPPVITPPDEVLPVYKEGTPLERFRAQIAGLYAVTDNVNATAVIALDPAALSGGGTLLPGTWDFTVGAHDFAGNEADPVHAQITVTPVDPSLLVPEIVYTGGLTLTAARGKSAAETESAILAQTAVYDNDALSALAAFSDGAMDAGGALLAGNHTVTLNAVDSDGNSAVPIVIGLFVRDGTDFSTDYNGSPQTAKGYSIGPLETINTWSAWIRLMPDPDNNRGNETPTRYGYILGHINGGNDAYLMSLEIKAGGNPRLNWGGAYYDFNNVDARTGEYLFLTVTRDTAAKELRCYVNGGLRQTLAFGAGIINTDLAPQGDFWIGRDNRGGGYLHSIFMGEIASVHIFGAARTAEEIKADMLGVDAGGAGVLYSAQIVPDREPPVFTVTLGGAPCPDTLYRTAGDGRVGFAVTVADNADGAMANFRIAYSEGAVDIFGWLTEGTHTVTMTANDKSGNVGARVITLIVGARPDESGGGGGRPGCGGDSCACDPCAGDNGESGGGGGCSGCRDAGAAAAFVPLLAAAALFISRRKYS
jgi:hypothetical protein